MAETKTVHSEASVDPELLLAEYERAKAEYLELYEEMIRLKGEEARLNDKKAQLKHEADQLATDGKVIDAEAQISRIAAARGGYAGIAGRKRLLAAIERLLAVRWVSAETRQDAERLRDTILESLADQPEVIRIPPMAFFRSMWTLFCTCLLRPCSRTEIDLATGRIVPFLDTEDAPPPHVDSN